jgi:hypothetical protein
MSRHPAMWLLRAAVFVMQLLVVAYFVCVQINAIAYLVGKRGAIISGTAPPIRIDGVAPAAGDIVIGLVFEAVVALIAAIVVAIALTSLRDAGRLAAIRRRKASGAD